MTSHAAFSPTRPELVTVFSSPDSNQGPAVPTDTDVERLHKGLLRLPLVWDRDRLAVTDLSAVARINKARLSPSTSSAIQSCPSRMVIDRLLPRTEDPFGAAELGTSAHALLEDFFSLPGSQRTKETLERLLAVLHTQKKHKGSIALPPADQMGRWRDEVLLRSIGIFEIEDPRAVQVAATEIQLNDVDVAGVPFNGVIDRVDLDLEGDRKANDYKTGRVKMDDGRFKDSHGIQLRVYDLAVEAKYGEPPSSAHIYYTQYGVSRQVDLSPRLMDETATEFRDSWDKLKRYSAEASFPAISSPLCGWCPLATVCPVSRADGKTARVPLGNLGETLHIATIAPLDSARIPMQGKAAWSRGGSAPHRSADRHIEPAGDPLADVLSDPFVDTAAPGDPGPDRDEPTAAAEEPGPGKEPIEDRAPTAPPAIPARAPAYDDEPLWLDEGDDDMASAAASAATAHWGEDKRWEETLPDGRLNPDSHAATAVFGIVTLAVDQLARADQDITRRTVEALSSTLGTVLQEAQRQLSGSDSWHRGLNTRLRGALYSTIKSLPLPFGQDEAAWEEWSSKAGKRLIAIATVSEVLWKEGPITERPWADLLAS